MRNILVVWCLTGVWHGAAWNFILWGLYYAALLMLEKFFLGSLLKKAPAFLSWLYAFFVVNLGWVLFNLTDFTALSHALHTMFIWQGTSLASVISADSDCFLALIYLPVAFLFSFPVLKKIPKPKGLAGELVADGIYGGLLLLCIVFIISSSYNPFIYFRF